jgi:hypothetical protein
VSAGRTVPSTLIAASSASLDVDKTQGNNAGELRRSSGGPSEDQAEAKDSEEKISSNEAGKK